VLDALDLDHGASQGQRQRLAFAFAHDGEDDVGAGLAAHFLDCVVQGHALDRGVVQFDHQIAAFDARLECGRVFDRGDDLDEAIFHADFDAQAAKFALGANLEFLEGFVIQIGGMRVEPVSMPLMAS
jgi:hypothetical protein